MDCRPGRHLLVDRIGEEARKAGIDASVGSGNSLLRELLVAATDPDDYVVADVRWFDSSPYYQAPYLGLDGNGASSNGGSPDVRESPSGGAGANAGTPGEPTLQTTGRVPRPESPPTHPAPAPSTGFASHDANLPCATPPASRLRHPHTSLARRICPIETKRTFCRICEALCGLEVDVDSGRVVDVRPDRSHPVTRGHACVKGIRQQQMYDSPDRLQRPLRREGERFVPATWDEANGGIGAKVRQLVRDHGPDSIAMYVGTAAGFSLLHPIFAQGFMEGLGSRNIYSTATQDCSNKFAVASAIYGFPFLQPMPDLERCECLFIVGGNPVVSKWAFGQVPNAAETLKGMVRRGARVFVVDPRRTETAKAGSDWVPIEAGADLWFYLGFLNELFAVGGDRRAPAEHLVGVEALREAVAPWTPEICAETTGIEAAHLRRLVRAFLDADGAALYCSTGVNMGGHGALCFWLQEAINALSGNLDRLGGTLLGRGIFDFAAFGKKHGLFTKTTRSRIGDFQAVNDAFPGGILADEILTPGEGQVRALFVTGGNPLITMPNSERLREAFEHLELLVVVDIFQNETASVAHWVLPATSPLQRFDLPFAFPLFMGMQLTPYLQATEPVLPPQGEQRDEATIYHDLMRASGVGFYGSKAATLALEGARRLSGGFPQRGLMSLLLRICGQGSFDALLGDGVRMREPNTTGFLGSRVATEDGRVQLAPDDYLQALTEAVERPPEGALRLITKRDLRTHNSWTHNLESFVGPKRRGNAVYMHPEDAERVGLSDGALADVTSRTATIRLPARLLKDLKPGTVAVPHGWGHQGARGLSVASQTQGVNVNLLAADGPEDVCRLSGMARLTAISVRVEPAAGPLDTTHWSGVPPTERGA